MGMQLSTADGSLMWSDKCPVSALPYSIISRTSRTSSVATTTAAGILSTGHHTTMWYHSVTQLLESHTTHTYTLCMQCHPSQRWSGPARTGLDRPILHRWQHARNVVSDHPAGLEHHEPCSDVASAQVSLVGECPDVIVLILPLVESRSYGASQHARPTPCPGAQQLPETSIEEIDCTAPIETYSQPFAVTVRQGGFRFLVIAVSPALFVGTTQAMLRFL